jgi:hypothetical protein
VPTAVGVSKTAGLKTCSLLGGAHLLLCLLQCVLSGAADDASISTDCIVGLGAVEALAAALQVERSALDSRCTEASTMQDCMLLWMMITLSPRRPSS